jgi:prephenate dehydrogenase
VSVAVVGLGLIGGSLARDLAAGGARVLGWDRDAGALAAALACGAVHEALGEELQGVEGADAVVLAVPVLAAPGVLRTLAPRADRVPLVTDVGSTKRSVVAAAGALGMGDRFVGAHPLAGDHRSGWGASRTGLFRGARVYLTPGASCGEDAVRLARELWEGVGGRVETMDAAAHDRLLAWSSHLPQAVSSAFARALDAAGVPREAPGPGGRDVARLAASSPAMWADVALDNASELIPALAAAETELRGLRERIASGDGARVREWFAAGRGAGG